MLLKSLVPLSCYQGESISGGECSPAPGTHPMAQISVGLGMLLALLLCLASGGRNLFPWTMALA